MQTVKAVLNFLLKAISYVINFAIIMIALAIIAKIIGLDFPVPKYFAKPDLGPKGYRVAYTQYGIPSEMDIETSSIIELSISRKNEKRLRIRSAKDSIISDTLLTTSRIKASILDPEGGKSFQIVPLSTEEQLLDNLFGCQWKWSLTPLQTGERDIYLNISTRVKHDFGEHFIDVYNEKVKIKIKSPWYFPIKKHFREAWQFWIGGLILVPIGFILRRHFDQKDKKKEKEEQEKAEKQHAGGKVF